jgi:regulator of cell morphogenesis and NO signaling
MTENALESTLSELAKSQPNVAHAIERLGVAASRYPTLTARTVLEQLGLPANLEAPLKHSSLWIDGCDVCWQSASLSDIIAHILAQHHEFLRLELPRIQLLLHRLLSRESADIATRAKAILDAFVPLKAEVEMHLMKEEQILFPLTQQIENAAEPFSFHCGSVRNPISVMMMEHDNAKQALARIREVTENFTLPADATATLAGLYAALQQLERDLLTHIREEDDILFPRTVALEDELFKS